MAITILARLPGWKNPYEGTNAAVTVADGAVLAGEFVIPFDKDETLNTFELQLIGKKKGTGANFEGEDEYILQTWSVKLDDASIDATLKDTEYHYSIYRNHLYQIGKRGGGDDPDKPGVDPDKPQPLDKSQELVIKINDQWEFIHDLRSTNVRPHRTSRLIRDNHFYTGAVPTRHGSLFSFLGRKL